MTSLRKGQQGKRGVGQKNGGVVEKCGVARILLVEEKNGDDVAAQRAQLWVG